MKPPPQHLLRLNNRRLNTTTSFLKAGAAGKGRGAGIPASMIGPMLHQKTPAATVSSPTATQHSSAGNPFTYSKVDNRPRHLLFAGLESGKERPNIVSFVQSIGCHVENVLDMEAGDEAVGSQFAICFATRRDAEVVS